MIYSSRHMTSCRQRLGLCLCGWLTWQISFIIYSSVDQTNILQREIILSQIHPEIIAIETNNILTNRSLTILLGVTTVRIQQNEGSQYRDERRKLTQILVCLLSQHLSHTPHSLHCRSTISQHKPQLGSDLIHLPVSLTDRLSWRRHIQLKDYDRSTNQKHTEHQYWSLSVY